MQKSKFLFAALAMSATALFFGSCNPKENEPNDGEFIIDASVVNGSSYNNLVDEVRATYLIYEGDYVLHTIAAAQYNNGGFKMTLPATPEINALQSIGNIWENGGGITVSDPTAKVCLLESFEAYKNGQHVDNLVNLAMLTDGAVSLSMFIRYAYADKDCDVTGEVSEGDAVNYEMHFKKGWNTVYFNIVHNNEIEVEHLTTTKPVGVDFAWHFTSDIDGGEEEGEMRLISRITESAVFTSDYYSSSYAGGPYAPVSFEFAYDNSSRLKELYAFVQNAAELLYTYNYDIANEVRITDKYGDTYRAMLSGGKANSIKWGNPQYTAALTYNAQGYLTDYNSNDSYHYGDCNAVRLVWNSGNVGALEELNCTTQVYHTYKTWGYSQELNNKTKPDLNVLFFDFICAESPYYYRDYSGSLYGEIYEHPANLFAMAGVTGKRSKNYIKELHYLGEIPYPAVPQTIYTEATAPAVGDILYTRYICDFDVNAVWSFDSDGYPNKFSRKAEVTKTETICNGGGERVYVEPNSEYERERWTEEYGAGPWFYIYNMQTGINGTVKYDTYTWNIEYIN
ncbi:MAG: hypothetical protein LBB53_05025 [Prevotellaceae bacterium]|nr:hypothetical protein [Prevotellaceae bacterium]